MKNKKLKNNLIQIFYVGLPKCASTWLYKSISQTNKINTSWPRDIHFFDLNYQRGYGWYHKFFNLKKVNIDICHDYILYEEAIKSIYNYNPRAIIIYHFRDPTELLNSLYKETEKGGFIYFKEHGYEIPETYNQFLSNPLTQKILNFKNHLEIINNYFESEKVIICTTDYINQNPKRYFNLILRKLGLDPINHDLQFYKVVPSEKKFLTKQLIKFLAKLAVFIRKTGNIFLMRLINLKILLDKKIKIEPNKKVSLNKIQRNKNLFDRKVVNKLFKEINGIDYEKFLIKYSLIIKNII